MATALQGTIGGDVGIHGLPFATNTFVCYLWYYPSLRIRVLALAALCPSERLCKLCGVLAKLP